MARNDIRIHDAGGHNVVPTYQWQVDDTTSSSINPILVGELLKEADTSGNPYAIKMVATHAIGTAAPILGVSANDGTETSTANGVVDVYIPLPGVIFAGKATTAANFDTQSEINALVGDQVTIDVSTTGTVDTQTIDEDDGTSLTSPLVIIGGDPNTTTVHFLIRTNATVLGNDDVA